MICKASIYQVLLLTAFIICVVSACDIVTEGQGTVYMHYVASSTLGPLYEVPADISDITQQYEHASGAVYCRSDGGSKYLFTSLDNALDIFEEFENSSSSSLLIAFIGNGINVSFPLRHSHAVLDLKSFTLQGTIQNAEATIVCDENVQLSFINICSVAIQSTIFSNCGTLHAGGIAINNSHLINITAVTVKDGNNSGIEVTLDSSSSLTCSANDSISLYTISNSVFSENGLIALNGTPTYPSYGGGINIRVLGEDYKNIINVKDSKFIRNTAMIGGALAYSTNNPESQLHVSGCHFMFNHGTVHGGAAHLSGANIYFENSSFTGNTAIYTAGAIYHFILIQSGFTLSSGIEVSYDNCSFDRNSAEGSGCLLFTTSVTSSPEVATYKTVNVSNCKFHDNTVNTILFFGETSCIIHSSDISLSLVGTTFEKNSATAICIESAKINFYGIVKFNRNRGFLGGAVYNMRSQMAIYENTSVLFLNNRAVYGGAIYQNGMLPNSKQCLFDVVKSENVELTFFDNQAHSSGSDIYIYEPNSVCINDIKRPELNFTLFPNSVTSNAFNITFHEPVMGSEESGYKIDLILGQYIVFNVTIKDFFNQETFAQVNVFIQSPNERVFNIPYQINGFQHFSLESGVNSPKVSIVGPEVFQEIDDQYKLLVYDVELSPKINVTLKPCPIGFIYSGTTGQCECFHSEYLACDFTTATACIHRGYWIGNMTNTGSNGSNLIVASCASLYCQNTNGNCTLCPVTDKEDFCLLPYSSSEQCLSNRQGFICTECIPDYAFTFGAVRCVHSDTCSNGIGVVPFILNIIFLVFTVTILIVLLKLNYKLSSGYLFCFIYYFSIVRHLLNSVVVGDEMLLIVSIVTSFTQLNPQFLGYIPICFSAHISVLQQQVLLYLNPLVISILVFAVIGISRCFSKFIKFGDNTLVKAMCLLMLLSFTALTETSFNILNPVRFDDLRELYVNIEPTIKYFDFKSHLPWFLVATMIILFLVVPFTFLLLFAPLLTRCINLTRVKPFLDEFQGCYKDRFRWMAGYYFIARFIYLLVLTAPRYLPVTVQYIIQIISFGILVVHMLLQPYENTWLNFVDSVLLADLMLMTLLFGNTAGVVFADVPKLRIVLVSALLIIPVLYLLVLVGVTIGNRWFKLNFDRVKSIFTSNNEDKEQITTQTAVEGGSRSLSFSVGLREPLLDVVNDFSPSTSPIVTTTRQRKRLVSHSVIGSPRDYHETSLIFNEDLHKDRAVTIPSQALEDETTSNEGSYS